MQEQVVTQQPNVSDKKGLSRGFIIAIIFGTVILMGVVGVGAYFIGKNLSSKKEVTKEEEGSNEDKEEDQLTLLEEDMIFKTETATLPDWAEEVTEEGKDGPWAQDLYLSTSEDGIDFTGGKLFLEHAGVISLLFTKDKQLVAVFQYFSYVNKDLFDVIAYATSSDFGKNWSSIKKLQFEDLVKGANPCDPELVELKNGQLRLYFTHHPRGEKYPQLFSAISDSIDSSFLSEGVQLHTDEIILDPTVVYFNNVWHHYTLWHGTSFEYEEGVELTGIHSTSEDGLAFELQEEIDLNMQFLGDVIVDDGGLRFYSGQTSAFSNDGYEWELDDGIRVEGADPGIVKLPNGNYLMIYTKMEKVAE